MDPALTLSPTIVYPQKKAVGENVLNDIGTTRPALAYAGMKRSFTESEGNSRDTGKCQKRSTKAHAGDVQYGCPFRLRNPTRFNLRDQAACVLQSYPSLSSLK
jgi:hypothetical protein